MRRGLRITPAMASASQEASHDAPDSHFMAALVLAGCASFSPDGGFARVGQLTKERTGQTPSYQRTVEQSDSAQARVAELLKQPLTADSAVELALLNNRGLQASFSRARHRRVRSGAGRPTAQPVVQLRPPAAAAASSKSSAP